MVRGQPSLPSEFQGSQGYIKRLHLKRKKKLKKFRKDYFMTATSFVKQRCVKDLIC